MVDMSNLVKMKDDMVDTVVRVIGGTTDPEKSAVAKALKTLFAPLTFIKRAKGDNRPYSPTDPLLPSSFL